MPHAKAVIFVVNPPETSVSWFLLGNGMRECFHASGEGATQRYLFGLRIMLLLKRLITAFVLFCMLFIVLFFGALMVGGAIAGGRAGAANSNARDFQSG